MTLPPIVELVPHRPPMLLLERVLSFGADRVVCGACPGPDCIFVRGGALPGVITLEYMAQAAAACLALARPDERAARARGLLVAVRRFSIASDLIAVGTQLEVMAALSSALGAAARFDCNVTALGQTLASAELTVYVEPEPS